jgi:hypothetical protein
MVICKLAVHQMCTNTLIILICTTENLMNNEVDVYISFANRIGHVIIFHKVNQSFPVLRLTHSTCEHNDIIFPVK